MAWNVASNCSNYGNPALCPNQGPQVIGNFDLYLYETVGGVRSLKVTSISNVTSTNYRFLRYDGVATNATYDVVIKKNFLDLGNPPAYGLAWVMFSEY